MLQNKRKLFIILISSFFVLLSICFIAWGTSKSYASELVARPSNSGVLHLEGTQIKDQNGNDAVLNGVSTHGLTYCPSVIKNNLFNKLSEEWNCNLIRLAMYSEEYCNNNKDENLRLINEGIEYAINNDLYVIIDWHILYDYNPNMYKNQAIEFFNEISSKYHDCPNVIYEICNEPNRSTSWKDIKDYSESVIPVIRNNDSKSLIIVGTPNNSLVEFDKDADVYFDYENIMYSFHFYASSHGEEFRNNLNYYCEELKLPIFVSEYGISESSGDGNIDFDEAAKWNELLNAKKISRAIWSFSNINESSAIFKNYIFNPDNLDDSSLSVCGYWTKHMLAGDNLFELEYPQPNIIEKIFRLRSHPINSWPLFFIIAIVFTFIIVISFNIYSHKYKTKNLSYDTYIRDKIRIYQKHIKINDRQLFDRQLFDIFIIILIPICIVLFIIYLTWRILCSTPFEYGFLCIFFNVVLLIVEIVGFFESVIMGYGLITSKKYKCPVIPVDAYPDVDVFISTYNEPEDLLKRTVNGCKNMSYPDKSKVHIYLCDDNRRKNIKDLAKELGVNYFDRDTNEGAKAGNLNHALSLTNSPYIVTFDADMIPKKEFLLRTIPYFVDIELTNKKFAENNKQTYKLGLLQSPQNFYQRDVFQHFLYLEKNAPNEQDFFYKIIEPSRTKSNSVIYGGSNTVLSREALESIGGFYTESITEDFATGMLMEANNFISLGISEPLANGQTPNNLAQHIQQRIRWGRGVIATRKQIMKKIRRNFTFMQKLNYWCSSTYWYFPFKYLVYLICPLLYAVFGLRIMNCTTFDLLVYCIPQLFLQIIILRLASRGGYSFVLNNVSQVCLTPYVLIPYLKEIFGFSLTKFKVTDKTSKTKENNASIKELLPFLVFSALSLYALVKSLIYLFITANSEIFMIIFWLVLNLYYVLISIFLITGNRKEDEDVNVYVNIDSELRNDKSDTRIKAQTTQFNENFVYVKYDCDDKEILDANIMILTTNRYTASIKCSFIEEDKMDDYSIYKFKVCEKAYDNPEYLNILYDRDPSLPQRIIHLNFVNVLWTLIYRLLKDKISTFRTK